MSSPNTSPPWMRPQVLLWPGLVEGSRTFPFAFTIYLTSQASPQMLQDKQGSPLASGHHYQPRVCEDFVRRPRAPGLTPPQSTSALKPWDRDLAKDGDAGVRDRLSPVGKWGRQELGSQLLQGPPSPPRHTQRARAASGMRGGGATLLCTCEGRGTGDPAENQPSRVPSAKLSRVAQHQGPQRSPQPPAPRLSRPGAAPTSTIAVERQPRPPAAFLGEHAGTCHNMPEHAGWEQTPHRVTGASGPPAHRQMAVSSISGGKSGQTPRGGCQGQQFTYSLVPFLFCCYSGHSPSRQVAGQCLSPH